MSVIVKTSYERASQYRGKNVSTKIGSKNHNVYFKVILDDSNIEDALKYNDVNIIMYEYEGSSINPIYNGIDTEKLYIIKYYEFGNDLSEADIIQVLNDTPTGVTPIIKVPDSYKNFEFVCKMCDKYKRIRFCGGVLFCASGCRLGCCGKDIVEGLGIKHSDNNLIKEGCACALDILSEENVELSITEKKIRTKTEKSVKKPKTKMFSSLMGGFNVEL